MRRPRIIVVALGGTIAMTPDPNAGGATPTLSGEAIVRAVPELDSIGDIVAHMLLQKPGAHLTFADGLALASSLDRALVDFDGAVVMQGTDTIEETALLLDLVVRAEKPVVVTGAMRLPSAASSDSKANLLAAVRTAASPAAMGLGTLVVMNEEIHAARFVHKMHTTSLAAFRSPIVGPIGWLSENSVRIATRPNGRKQISINADRQNISVALLVAAMGDPGTLIDLVPGAGYHGLVFEGFGAAHVSVGMADALERVARQIPVLIASRCGSGETLSCTYGFPGSEIDLQKRGLVITGWLTGVQARVLLSVLLMSGADRHVIAAEFEAWRTMS